MPIWDILYALRIPRGWIFWKEDNEEKCEYDRIYIETRVKRKSVMYITKNEKSFPWASYSVIMLGKINI